MGRPRKYQHRLVTDPKTGEEKMEKRPEGKLWQPEWKEAKQLAKLLVEDPLYLHNLRQRLIQGTAPPAVENMLWERAYGKVKEEISVHKVQVVKIVHDFGEETAKDVLPGEVIVKELTDGSSSGESRSGEDQGTGRGEGDSPAVEHGTSEVPEVPDEIP